MLAHGTPSPPSRHEASSLVSVGVMEVDEGASHFLLTIVKGLLFEKKGSESDTGLLSFLYDSQLHFKKGF